MSLATTGAEIIPFPARPPTGLRMSVRDRIEALRWADTVSDLGYARVLLDTSESAPEVGDCLLVYRPGANWAAWGVGRTAEGFTLWCPESGATVAQFKTLGAALERIETLS